MKIVSVQVQAGCQGSQCPTLFGLDNGDVLVQGYVVEDREKVALGIEIPEGENIVRLSGDQLRAWLSEKK